MWAPALPPHKGMGAIVRGTPRLITCRVASTQLPPCMWCAWAGGGYVGTNTVKL